MKKTAISLSAALVFGGLTACANNGEGALEGQNNDMTRPIGYYSNEDLDNNARDIGYNKGRAYGNNDNDGPITDMFDRRGALNDYNLDTRYNDDRIGNNVDYNYSGHLNNRDDDARSSYFNGNNGELAERVANRVSQITNVDDARVIVYGDMVLVAVDTADDEADRVEPSIRRAAEQVATNKDVRVVTDESMYIRVRNVDNSLRNGMDNAEYTNNIRGIFNEIGENLDMTNDNDNRAGNLDTDTGNGFINR